MPRKPEPSFRLKEIIWDLAAVTGAKNLSALQKDLDYKLEKLRKDTEEDFFEDTPDIRTIRRIIELDMNSLPPEVVVDKLPRHMWRLRNDYKIIERLVAEGIEAKREVPEEVATEPKRDKPIGRLEKTEIVQEQEQPRGEANALKLCPAPPGGVDVAQLRKWGIPAKKAPEILFKWLGFHRKGSHEMYQSFRNLEEDLIVRKIPFKQAEINLEAELWAREFKVLGMLEDIELRRKYRSWENLHNYNAFRKEIDFRNRPAMEARERHLTELANTLIGWKVEIEKAVPEDKYNNVVNIREDSLFESIMTHCFNIARTFEALQITHIAPNNGEQRWKWQKEMQLINRLLKEIDRALLKKNYADEWCLDCTSKKEN